MPSPHSVKVNRYARRRRILVRAMGSVCVQCGERDTDKLEFHHTEPREWVAANVSRWSRQVRYEEDWDDGVLELLCGKCNKKAGSPIGEDYGIEEVPF